MSEALTIAIITKNGFETDKFLKQIRKYKTLISQWDMARLKITLKNGDRLMVCKKTDSYCRLAGIDIDIIVGIAPDWMRAHEYWSDERFVKHLDEILDERKKNEKQCMTDDEIKAYIEFRDRARARSTDKKGCICACPSCGETMYTWNDNYYCANANCEIEVQKPSPSLVESPKELWKSYEEDQDKGYIKLLEAFDHEHDIQVDCNCGNPSDEERVDMITDIAKQIKQFEEQNPNFPQIVGAPICGPDFTPEEFQQIKAKRMRYNLQLTQEEITILWGLLNNHKGNLCFAQILAKVEKLRPSGGFYARKGLK